MEKICVIPSSLRTGSTYLIRFLEKYTNYLNLKEFFNLNIFYRPRIDNEIVFGISEDITDKEIFYLLSNEKQNQFNDILKNNWKDKWHTNIYYLNNRFKIEIDKNFGICDCTTKQLIKNHLNIFRNSKQSFISKVFPTNFYSHPDILNINVIKQIKDIKFILLERRNIFDICLSNTYSSSMNYFNCFSEKESQTIDKDVICFEKDFQHIYKNISCFIDIKNQLKDMNITTINFDEMFDDNILLNQLNLDKKNENKSVALTTKLYSNYSKDELINFIKNKDDFFKYYDELMKKIKRKNYG